MVLRYDRHTGELKGTRASKMSSEQQFTTRQRAAATRVCAERFADRMLVWFFVS